MTAEMIRRSPVVVEARLLERAPRTTETERLRSTILHARLVESEPTFTQTWRWRPDLWPWFVWVPLLILPPAVLVGIPLHILSSLI